MIIDATKKWKEEGYHRVWPKVVDVPKEVKQKVAQLLEKYVKG